MTYDSPILEIKHSMVDLSFIPVREVPGAVRALDADLATGNLS